MLDAIDMVPYIDLGEFHSIRSKVHPGSGSTIPAGRKPAVLTSVDMESTDALDTEESSLREFSSAEDEKGDGKDK